MYHIDGTNFEKLRVRKVTLNLENCNLNMEVVFYTGNDKIVRIKHYDFQTNCDVIIDDYIEKLKEKVNVI
jgi:hypothetical protein